MTDFLQIAVPVVGGMAIGALVTLVLAACMAAGRADELSERMREERLKH